MHRPATFSVTLVALPGVDGVKAFRALLKAALRHYGLRAIDVRETHARNEDERARSSSFSTPTAQTREISMSAFSERVQAQREEQKEKQKETGLFKVDDFKPNKELLLTVRHLDEQVEMFGKQVDLLNFVETGKQLQLNWTTSQWLIDHLGDDPEDWPDKQVVLHLAEYEYNREKKLGIRLKLPGTKPAVKESTIIPPQRDGGSKNPARSASRTDDMDDEIPF